MSVQTTLGLHLKNLYKHREMSRAATAEESSVVQTKGRREVHRSLTLYNLRPSSQAKRGRIEREWRRR